MGERPGMKTGRIWKVGGSSGAGITSSVNHLTRRDLNLDPLELQQLLLATGPPLQPHDPDL